MGKGNDPNCAASSALLSESESGHDFAEPLAVSLGKPGREINEDNFLHLPDIGLAAAFDGMGGHVHGAAASSMAVSALRTCADAIPPEGERKKFAVELLERVRGEMLARKTVQPHLRDADCTSVLALRDGDSFEVAWSGDSRAYLIDPDGNLTVLTLDHSGFDHEARLSENQKWRIQFALDKAQGQSDAFKLGGSMAKKAYRKRNVLGASATLGEIGYLRRQCEPGSLVLLTSDGVHDNLTLDQIRQVAAEQHRSPDQLPLVLADEARRASLDPDNERAKPDDITALILPL